jgi:phosphoesterase RecJ-like protein
MELLLEKVYPGKEVAIHCADGVLPETFRFLPGALRVQGVPVLREKDAIVFLDCAEPKLTEMETSCPVLFDRSHPSLNIDHHPTNTRYALENFVFPDASSACEILVHLADALGWPLDSDSATCLLLGIETDTGGFLHSNTSAATYRTAARLLRAGARGQEITQEVFRKAKLSTLKLWGRVLEKIMVTEEGGAVAAVTEGDFQAADADYEELTGAIDYVNAVPGMRFSLILSERNGKVRGSRRTVREDVDVAAMASKWSGGGHTKAAGFAIPGKLKPEVRWKVVPESSPAKPQESPLAKPPAAPEEPVVFPFA